VSVRDVSRDLEAVSELFRDVERWLAENKNDGSTGESA
jgi:hypothetical protein